MTRTEEVALNAGVRAVIDMALHGTGSEIPEQLARYGFGTLR